LQDTEHRPIANAILNGAPVETSTDVQGHYYIEVPYKWSGMVKPVKSGYTFEPSHLNITQIAADLDGLNFTGKLDVTGIGDGEPTFYVRPYPNPTSGEVNVDLPQPNSGFSVKVFTTYGAEVFSDVIGNTESRFRFQLREQGIFILKIVVGTRLYVSKIVVK
jgi:hypothetical protein